ncbi:MAG: serine protease [Polyangia bacterium]
MAWADRKKIIESIEGIRKSRVISYVTSDRGNANANISKDASPFIHDFLSEIGPTERIDLLLYTAGGDTLAAFGICQLLREYCNHLGVLVPFRCHSAGTLIALGADDIVMTRGATLSPIDPSVAGPLSPAVEVGPGQRQLVPVSVETVAGFKDLVMKDWKLRGENLCAAFKALADKVHPLALGDVYRARQQIEFLAKTLLEVAHREDSNKIRRIVSTFARELGSHDYPITRSSARRLLGPQVAPDNQDLERLMWELYSDYAKEMCLREPFDPSQLPVTAGVPTQQVTPILLTLALIETTAGGDVAEREVRIVQFPSPIGPMMQAQVVRAGWRHYT